MSRLHFVVLACSALLAPLPAVAQSPALLSTWITYGSYSMGRPWHFGFDAVGNVFVTDLAEERVFVMTPDGSYVASWTCPAIPARDFAPAGIAVGSGGVVYVTTPYPNGPAPFWVTQYTTSGGYLGSFGTMGSGSGQVGQSFDAAVDGGGNVYLADFPNFRVDVLSSAGTYVAQWGSYGAGPGQFHGPLAVAVSPAGLVYVTDGDTQRIEVFTASGTFVRQWGSYGTAPGQFAGPWGIALDAAGNVYVADSGNSRIQAFTSTGEFITQWGAHGSGPGEFNQPKGIGIGPDGRIYVADSWNSRIQVFGSLPTPTRSKSWGQLKAAYR